VACGGNSGGDGTSAASGGECVADRGEGPEGGRRVRSTARSFAGLRALAKRGPAARKRNSTADMPMGRRARDPKETGKEPIPPWRPDELCPCNSGRLYAQCCLGIDSRAYKSPVGRRPPGSTTGFSHARCYMGWTGDCDKQISGEHFISASVLTQLGDLTVKLDGVPWLPTDETRIVPIVSLRGNILCKRHNEALAQLDAMGANFFAAIKMMHDDIFNRKTLSRRWKWFLFSGEDLELWLLKTAIGLFHSGNVAKERKKLIETQTINPVCYDILYGGILPAPCGLYVEPIQFSEQINQFQLQPLSDDEGRRMVGLRMTYMSFALTLLFEPAATYGPDASDSKTYRPNHLIVRNDRRTHTVMLTWPRTASNVRRIVRVGY